MARKLLSERYQEGDIDVKSKERVIWIGSLVIVISISLFLFLQYQTKLSYAEQKMTSLSNDNTKLQQGNEDYVTQVAELKGEIEILVNSDKVAIRELQREGYTGQLKDIVADLKTHSELIPYKGIKGGTMGFYSENDIHVLTDKWVLAYFEDGHISGYMLLRYDTNEGAISWRVIDSYLNGK
ncbi:hypothetical protein [Desulfosporosinus hippei]|uniref:DUF4829 domain-containing protein n=1 Tax=Desulfosporosinus hippei DSM 8344 TaxID=1121419 RepID=A0A1G8BCT9_9FIRM|nr:hypothetical protein [Desulfosporosinus hippei]SDH30884.1 hypothetical protein SAMN05443529_1122 [Desulfosporosinus hippei DSM 8344]